MIDWHSLWGGIELLLNWQIPLVIFSGMLMGLVIGVIPGMTAALGIAVLLPLTFVMSPLTALMLLTSVYTGSLTGGGILAILINTPGTPGAVATTFDGYPMTRKGMQNEAIGLQITASIIGGFFSYLMLLFFIKPMAWMALKFGPSEMLFLTIFVLVVIGTLHGEQFSRSFFAGIFGLILFYGRHQRCHWNGAGNAWHRCTRRRFSAYFSDHRHVCRSGNAQPGHP